MPSVVKFSAPLKEIILFAGREVRAVIRFSRAKGPGRLSGGFIGSFTPSSRGPTVTGDGKARRRCRVVQLNGRTNVHDKEAKTAV